MKLYYAPGTCAMAAHIALRESQQPFNLELVKFGQPHKTDMGKLLTDINPKNSVPALEIDGGEILTENAVILQYIADKQPIANMIPAAGTMARYRVLEMMNFFASELHKGCFAPLFSPMTPDDYKPVALANLDKKMAVLESKVPAKGFLFGDQFTVADAYAFPVLNWTNFLKIDLGKWPKVKAYFERLAARPSVQLTLKAEGLA